MTIQHERMLATLVFSRLIRIFGKLVGTFLHDVNVRFEGHNSKIFEGGDQL